MPLFTDTTQDRTAHAPVSWAYHLSKEELVIELTKRSLPVEGTFAELRQRLLQNLREEGSLAVSMPAIGRPTDLSPTDLSPTDLLPTNLSTKFSPAKRTPTEMWKTSTTVAPAWTTTQADPWETPIMVPTVVTAATVPTTSIITTMSSVTTVTPSWAAGSTRWQSGMTPTAAVPQARPLYTSFQPVVAPAVQPPVIPPPSYVQVKAERPPIQVHRWKISFNGQGDPANFLERIEEICVSENILPDSLLPRMPDLLQGEAAYWFRNNRMTWRTWQEFVTDFKNFYFPINYQVDLEAEISRRLHKSNESVSTYLTELQTLIRRHGSLSTEQQLSWLYRNLLPEFRQYIRRNDFHDVASLSRVAREYEILKKEVDCTRHVGKPLPQNDSHWRQAQISTPASRPERRFINTTEIRQPASTNDHWNQVQNNATKIRREPRPINTAEIRQPPPANNHWRQRQNDIPENRIEHQRTMAAEITRTRPSTPPARPQQNTRPLAPLPNQNRPARLHVPFDPNVCWRCGETGHYRNRCTGQPRIFCSRCGKPDTLSKNCPCQRPENY